MLHWVFTTTQLAFKLTEAVCSPLGEGAVPLIMTFVRQAPRGKVPPPWRATPVQAVHSEEEVEGRGYSMTSYWDI